MTGTLYRWCNAAIGLPSALAAVYPSGTRAIVLLSDPRRFRVADLNANTASGPHSAPFDLAEVFEARAFNDRIELRWLQDAASTDALGQASVLSEVEVSLPTGWTPLAPVESRERIPVNYLLAGGLFVSNESDPMWATSSDSRVSPIEVPLSIARPTRLELVGVEYVAVEPQHGNSYIAAERLTALQPLGGAR